MTLRAAHAWLTSTAAVLAFAVPLGAQVPLRVGVADHAAVLTVGPALDDRALADAVRSGLPLRLRFRVELWRDELFDDLVDQADWSAVLAFEPLEARYLTGFASEDSLRAHDTYAAARATLERSYALAMRPRRPGRYYYLAFLEAETLSLTDLEELETWLRGELGPAVQGRRSVTGAVASGLKRLLIRVLDLPARRYEARSEPFTVP